MDKVLKIIILLLFVVAVFGRGYFPSDALYWSVYFVMFALVTLLWFAMFWVSAKRAEKVLGKAPDTTFFVGKVAPDVREDLTRGRMCFADGRAVLVGRRPDGSFGEIWSVAVEDINSVGFGTVAGVRKGFTIHGKNGDVSFTSLKIFKNRDLLYKALGWDMSEKEKA